MFWRFPDIYRGHKADHLYLLVVFHRDGQLHRRVERHKLKLDLAPGPGGRRKIFRHAVQFCAHCPSRCLEEQELLIHQRFNLVLTESLGFPLRCFLLHRLPRKPFSGPLGPTERCILHSREYKERTANWKPRNNWALSYFPEQTGFLDCP